MARSTTSPRTEIPTRETSDPPDERFLARRPLCGQCGDEAAKFRGLAIEDRRGGRLRCAAAIENEIRGVSLGEQARECPVLLGVIEIGRERRLLGESAFFELLACVQPHEFARIPEFVALRGLGLEGGLAMHDEIRRAPLDAL